MANRKKGFRPKSIEQQRREYDRSIKGLEKARLAAKPFRYAALLAAVRAAPPGVPAKIAEFTKGTRDEARFTAKQHRGEIRRWLNTNRPLEIWQVRQRLMDDTWGDYEIWVEYQGDYPSKAAAERARAEIRQKWLDGRQQGEMRRSAVAFNELIRASQQQQERHERLTAG